METHNELPSCGKLCVTVRMLVAENGTQVLNLDCIACA